MLDDQLIIWSLERALPKIWRDKFIKMMLVTSCQQKNSSSASASKLRWRGSSIEQTRYWRAILETTLRSKGPIFVVHQARPTVRAVVNEKISRAAVKSKTVSYMDQISIDKNYCKTPSAQDERMKQTYYSQEKLRISIRNWPSPPPPTNMVGRSQKWIPWHSRQTKANIA